MSVVSKEIIGKFGIVMDGSKYSERGRIEDCIHRRRRAKNMIVNTGIFIHDTKRPDGSFFQDKMGPYRNCSEVSERSSI